VRWAAPGSLFPRSFKMQENATANKIDVNDRLLKGDIYCLGYILWFLWKVENPFSEIDDREELMQILHKIFHDSTPTFPQPLEGNPFRGLIEMCWNLKLESRPTIDDIISILETGK
jgi:hypothetical protein